MTKRVISILLLAVMVLGVFAACGNDGPLTAEDAKKVVLKDLGTKESKVDSVDVHVSTFDGAACYAVYVSVGGQNWQYIVKGTSGEILQKAETEHAHSH